MDILASLALEFDYVVVAVVCRNFYGGDFGYDVLAIFVVYWSDGGGCETVGAVDVGRFGVLVLVGDWNEKGCAFGV